MNLPLANGWGEKHRLFVKWKYIEAKVSTCDISSYNLCPVPSVPVSDCVVEMDFDRAYSCIVMQCSQALLLES